MQKKTSYFREIFLITRKNPVKTPQKPHANTNFTKIFLFWVQVLAYMKKK